MTGEQVAVVAPSNMPQPTRRPRVLGALISALAFVVPTLAAFGPFIPGIGSFFAFRVAALCLLFMILFEGRLVEKSLARQLTVILVISWTASACVTVAAFGTGSAAWAELLSVGTGLALLLAVAVLSDPVRTLVSLMRGWLLGYLVVSGFAVREIFTGISMSSHNTFEPTLDSWGLTVGFFNPNNYATYLLYSYLALFLLFATTRWGIFKIITGIALASIYVFMPFTNSRTGLWVLAAFSVFLLFFSMARAKALRAIIAVLIVIAAVLISDWMRQNPFQDLQTFLNSEGYTLDIFGVTVNVDSSTYVRGQLVGVALAMAARYPILGWGPGSFSDYVSASGSDAVTSGILSPHNGFMEILSEYGLLVLVPFVLWLLGMVKICLKARAGGGKYGARSWMVALVGVLSLPVVLTMHSSTLLPSTTWLFLAFLLLTSRAAEGEIAVESEGEARMIPPAVRMERQQLSARDE